MAGIGWSILIPSRDGADTLPQCLASLSALTPPPDGMEIILVDNGSLDSTPTLMRGFAAAHGAIVLSEPRHGKSFALNAAIGAARGEMLVFLDDDVIADPDLMGSFAMARRQFPEAGVLAGSVMPHWTDRPPEWLQALASEGLSCGCTPENMEGGWISAIHVKGANMCFRRAAVGESRFAEQRVNFGSGTLRVGGLDTEFARRVGAASRVRFVPEARVRHVIAPAEMRWRGAWARYLRIGRNNAAQGLTGPGLWGPAARFVVYGLLALCAFVVGARTSAARSGLRAAMQAGAIDYLRRRPASP